MPKIGFTKDSQYEAQAGFNEGWGQVTDAKIVVHQYQPNKKTGEQGPPHLSLALTLQRTDEKGTGDGSEPVVEYLSIEKDLGKMRPGQANSPDDSDPSDQGGALGTEGNVIFAEEGAKFNTKTKFAIFEKSLEECGFKSEILGRGYAPDLIGLVAHFTQMKMDLRGLERAADQKEPTALAVDKIAVYPYEIKGKAGAAKKVAAKPAKSTPAPSASSAAPAPASAIEAQNGDSWPDEAVTIFGEIAEALSGKPMSLQKLVTMCIPASIKVTKDPAVRKSIQNAFRTDSFVISQAEAFGAVIEDGVITFG